MNSMEEARGRVWDEPISILLLPLVRTIWGWIKNGAEECWDLSDG